MIQPETWKGIHDEVKAAWVVVGPLVGVLIGAYVANRNQRKHWSLDNKRLEYRELISTLARSFTTIVNVESRPERSRENAMEGETAKMQALNVIRDRIFIGMIVKRLQLFDRWTEAVRLFYSGRDYKKFAADFEDIMFELEQYSRKLVE